MIKSHIILSNVDNIDPAFQKPKYVWNKEWNSPWQSAWGYIQRFRFSNFLTVSESFEALGPGGRRTASKLKWFSDFQWDDESRWIQVFGVPLNECMNRFIDTYLSPFVN